MAFRWRLVMNGANPSALPPSSRVSVLGASTPAQGDAGHFRAGALWSGLLFPIGEQHRSNIDIVLVTRTNNGHFQSRPGRLVRGEPPTIQKQRIYLEIREDALRERPPTLHRPCIRSHGRLDRAK